MTPLIIDGKNLHNDESLLSDRLASILGIDINTWNIRFGVVMKGRSGVLHTFDAVLESQADDKIATVLFLKETDDNKSETLMMHRVKSNDISAYANYVVVDHDFNSSDNTVREMCHLRDFKVNSEDLDAYRYTSMVRINGQNGNGTGQPTSVPRSSQKSKLPARRNRDRTKIVHEILGSVIYLKNASITQLIYRCNLNYKYAKNLLSHMVGKGLLEMIDYEGIGKRYEITGKGLKTFERLEFHEYI